MKEVLAALLLLAVSAAPALAGGLGTPVLSPSISSTRFFDPNRLLTTGGVKYSASSDLTLEPELGVGYSETERQFAGGIDESIHNVHAQAGWRLSLADTFYLSAAAKVPMLTVESAAGYTGQDKGSKYGYDFMRTFRSTPNWTGEMGLHLSASTDLTLYFDKSQVSASPYGAAQLDQRIGTRIILKFQ